MSDRNENVTVNRELFERMRDFIRQDVAYPVDAMDSVEWLRGLQESAQDICDSQDWEYSTSDEEDEEDEEEEG